MQSAETVLDVLRERGRKGLPLEGIYRQLFNPQLYLLAYGRISSNKRAMTPGPDAETAERMSMGKIERIIAQVREERYRFKSVRRLYIPKKDGKQRPLGLPSWSDKLLGEVVRLLVEAYYEPQFSDHSHGYRPGRGCHTALSEVARTWTGTTWFIEGDISGCFDQFATCSGGPLSQRNLARALRRAQQRASDEFGHPTFPALHHTAADGTPVAVPAGTLPSMHSFRHTVASRALLAGESVDEVAFLLGHRDATVTSVVYAREIADARRHHMRRSRMTAEFAGALRVVLDNDDRS